MWPEHWTNEWAMSIGSEVVELRGHGKWPIHLSITIPEGPQEEEGT